MQKEVNFHIWAILFIRFIWHVICEHEDNVWRLLNFGGVFVRILLFGSVCGGCAEIA